MESIRAAIGAQILQATNAPTTAAESAALDEKQRFCFAWKGAPLIGRSLFSRSATSGRRGRAGIDPLLAKHPGGGTLGSAYDRCCGLERKRTTQTPIRPDELAYVRCTRGTIEPDQERAAFSSNGDR